MFSVSRILAFTVRLLLCVAVSPRPHSTVSPTPRTGPSVTSVSGLIAPYLDAFVELTQLDFDAQPYVFCSKDPNRCPTSSAWSAFCKGIFLKWSGVACPPKMSPAPCTPAYTSDPPPLCVVPRSPKRDASICAQAAGELHNVAQVEHRLPRNPCRRRSCMSSSAADAEKRQV